MHPKYSETVDLLRMWAQQQKDIQCALILGSQVRKEFEGDEWSDLDILLLVDKPDTYIRTGEWVTRFGEAVCVTSEVVNLDWVNLTWYVKRFLFADNRALDFSIIAYDRIDDVLSINAAIHAHGYQIVYAAQPDVVMAKMAVTLAEVNEEFPGPPAQEDLHQIIDDLLYHLIWVCKKVRRGELWTAVTCINQHISLLLLQLIEAHTASIGQVSSGIRHDGRFLEQRAAPKIIDKLPECFARYDADDALRTVGHLLDLACDLSKDISEATHMSFNAQQFDAIRKLYGEASQQSGEVSPV